MAKKEAAPAADGQPGGKSKLKLIILIVVGLLLAVGLSIGGTWFILSKGDKADDAKPAEAASPATPVRQPALYQDLMPAFVVNFNHQGRTRYLQVSMALMSRDAAGVEKLKVHMPVLRNRLVMLLSGQDFAALQTPLGKEMLLQQALASVQELAQKETGSTVVEQVLFTNFVLQ
ncbi:flagellar basal body-associated protein FliL [Ectopseudomonas hydrolytica]|jgi:flagellar FliL protein|uniref:flagellar basal body-associated protein FliL n=1 Tax=Ectopseudomonas hydrolytica TaxID=2493633 RepID=UPI000278786E|nr:MULTISPECIES: flagellar basal body-associated protein FliL [Pseudomonas]ARS49507.1 flagellar basal body protein FliL [Pseudomonas mendocina]EJO94066.1 flagellar basal body-associated protein FliL [Pseudomonas mendocina DLHK]MBA4243183.1 flagellar basal body-associated protein FliL [Pseudomonas sp.]MBF8164481.1 flagellar basal body-associated protein FliL [Pseudomonas mendocina]UTH33388.1 flagellar basal body-associated protein FliL [Pseudomonas hydrolytica]